ncbi:MAG: type V CRISPR-associated endonuclease Cas1 [Xanthomonadaceae bacterium]|nr:type V CRISPR-associated endonuclease Cas1 [Xanthomonadaceae bacterium]
MLSYPDFKTKKLIIIFANEGEHFSFKNDNLLVKNRDDEIILQDTCHRILSLWIVGHGSITTGLLERSKRFGFSIYHLNINFRPLGVWNAVTEGNTLLRQKQYLHTDLDLAAFFVANKLKSQLALLKSTRKKSDELKDAIKKITTYLSQLSEPLTLEQMMGIEGNSARLYFKNWFDNIEWIGRKPRTKCNPINTLLDIGYTQLFYFIEALLNLFGFDLYKGFLHQTFYQRKSLVCDFQEPFRPIVDKVIKHGFNLGQIKEEDFTIRQGQYQLSFKAARQYTAWILPAILKEKDHIFLYIQNFYRSFMRDRPIEDYSHYYFLEGVK